MPPPLCPRLVRFLLSFVFKNFFDVFPPLPVGYAASVVPYWFHALQHWVVMKAPTFVVSNYVLSHHLGIYKRAMKKLAEKKE